MKNFPHQFNDLNKILRALRLIKEFSDKDIPMTEEFFGKRLTRDGIYTYRPKTLTVDDYFRREKLKPSANRGYGAATRDIRKLFELLGFIYLNSDKTVILTPQATQLLNTNADEECRELWRRAFLQLGLQGKDGEISYPYRILLRLVNTRFDTGIETKKLLLALEAENDSEEEFERILNLAKLNFNEIIEQTGTSLSMAKDAVKILPAIAEQLGDIKRLQYRAFPVRQTLITEDEISTVETEVARRVHYATKQQYWSTSPEKIAKEPTLREIVNVGIDLADAIRIRQQRLVEHQKCVRLLAEQNVRAGFDIYKDKFDCLAVQGQSALLYEVKTLASSLSDQESQTVKGVGQLKFYNYSIVQNQMKLSEVKEILVFSRMPSRDIIEFCSSIDILVIWLDEELFKYYSLHNQIKNFYPRNLF
jgi:hypothetical protein